MRSGPKLLTWAQTPPLVAAAFLGCGASVAVQSLPSSVLALGRPLDVLGAYFATVVVFALACGVVLDRRTLAVTAKTPPTIVAPALRAAPLSSLMPAIAALSAWSVTIGSAVLLFASGRIGYTAPTSHGGGSGGGDGGGSSGSSGDGSGGAAPPAPPVVDPTWGWTGLVLVGAGLGCLMVVLPSLVGSARVRPRVPGQPASRGGRSPLFAWFVAAAAMAKFAGEFAWPFLGAEVSQASALSVTPAVCAAGALVLSVLAWRARRSHTENAASRHALLHPELLSDNLDDVITTNTNGNNINSNTNTSSNISSNTNTNINTDKCVDGNRNNINSGCCHSTGTRSNSHSSLNIVDSDHPNSINSTAAAANKVHCVSRSDSCGGTGAARASDAGRCPHPAPPVIVIDVPGAGKAASAAGRCPDGDGSAAAGPAASSSTRDPYATPTRCPLLKRSTMLTFAVRVAGPLVPVFYVMALLTDLAMPMQGFGLNGVVAGHPLKPWVMPSMPLFTTALWCVLFELAPRFRGPARPTPRSRLLAGAALVAASSLFAAALAGAAQPSLSVLAQLPQHLCLGAGAALISVAAFEAACDGTGHTASAAQAAAATTNAATANAATANATNAASPAAFSLALPAGAPACPYRRCPVAITGGTVRLALLAASHAAAALASGAVGTRMPWLEDIARPAAFLAHAGIAAAGGAALWGFGVWEGR